MEALKRLGYLNDVLHNMGESIKHLDGIVLNNTKRQTGKKSNVSHFPTAEIECFRLYNLMVHKQ